jgi:hypothetical protein
VRTIGGPYTRSAHRTPSVLEVLATESGMLGSRSMDGLEYRASRHRSQPRRETIATTQSFHPLLDVNRKRTVDGGSIPTTQGMRFQKWTITLTKTFDMDSFPVDTCLFQFLDFLQRSSATLFFGERPPRSSDHRFRWSSDRIAANQISSFCFCASRVASSHAAFPAPSALCTPAASRADPG